MIPRPLSDSNSCRDPSHSCRMRYLDWACSKGRSERSDWARVGVCVGWRQRWRKQDMREPKMVIRTGGGRGGLTEVNDEVLMRRYLGVRKGLTWDYLPPRTLCLSSYRPPFPHTHLHVRYPGRSCARHRSGGRRRTRVARCIVATTSRHVFVWSCLA